MEIELTIQNRLQKYLKIKNNNLRVQILTAMTLSILYKHKLTFVNIYIEWHN